MLWFFVRPPVYLHRVLGAWSGHSNCVTIHPTSFSAVSAQVRARLSEQVNNSGLSYCSYCPESEGPSMSYAS